MEYLFEVTETIAGGVGFSHYGALHIGWLAAFVICGIVCCLSYRHMGQRGRAAWRKTVAALVVVDELIKQVLLICTGNWIVKYLPLHLCSINIFLVVWHAFRPNQTLGNFLYMVCLPGAVAALLFPSWTKLPGWNIMCIHSFSVHILLAVYPLVLALGGDIRPGARQITKCLGILAVMAAGVYLVNMALDTNFFFLMSASKGNPLYIFEQAWGSHLYGFPVLIAGVLLVMFGPVELYRSLARKKAARRAKMRASCS